MGKESELESAKEHRKAPNSNASPPTKETTDLYKTIITFEEQEAITRSPSKDSDCFLATCDRIRDLMAKISKLKSSNDATAKASIHELKVQAALAFVELKKLNRMEKFRTKFARDSLTASKSGVDSRHLQLQNLLYEVMHLQKEVVKCLQFKSKDELIELVPEAEFFSEAPASIARPETRTDAHQLRLARLEWELTQRKQLSALCDQLSESKKSIAQSIASKQTRLDNLAPQLRAILEASKPLQESLSLPLDKQHREHEKASLLPSPLYVLYTRVAAYRDACDTSLAVSVEGSEEEAKRAYDSVDVDSDSDAPEPVEEPVHKKRHRVSKEARDEERRARVVHRHPLVVQAIVGVGETKLTLRFVYLTCLKIVTVEATLDAAVGGVTAADLLLPDSILRELYPGDFGHESPNPANRYQLMRHNLTFSALGLGNTYKWAQRMAGLDFVNEQGPLQGSARRAEVLQNSVESVLKEIKRRVRARLELCAEIRLLEAGNFPAVAGSEPMPQKVSAYLARFTAMTWASYSACRSTRGFCDNSLVCETDIFYEALLKRGSYEMLTRIAIKPDYPKTPAVFAVEIASATVDSIRDIEREVNVMWKCSPTLASQLQRLRACFDVYLETEGFVTREKTFFHSVKGRVRNRPYKYLALGGGLFTHR